MVSCFICKNVKDIEIIANRYDVVSFDVFDTLVLRNVGKAVDVFEIVEAKAKSMSIDVPGFAKTRVEAESSAAAHVDSGRDVTIEDIYRELPFPVEEKERLKKLELDIEKRIIVPNGKMIDLANRLRNKGKMVIATSDMYLPSSFISEILSSFGCSVDRLYVSGDIGLRKSRGTLFSYVMKDLDIGAKSTIHIGDNRRSDYVMPAIKGISSVMYTPDLFHGTPSTSSIADTIVCGLVRNQGFRESSPLSEIGYSCLGPLLVGMCQWIHHKVKKVGKASLRFLSRDGYILSRAYSLMYPNQEYKYSYVSRRSLTVPLLADVQCFADVLEAIPYVKRVEDMSSFLTKLGIDDDSIRKKMEKKYGAYLTRKDISDGSYDSLFDEIKKTVWNNAIEERRCMQGYLMDDYSDVVFTVDLGWYGSIQKCLEKVVSGRIHGLYLGLLKHDSDYCLENADGYVYDYRKGDVFDSSLVFSFNGLIETFFSAPHGSVKRYVKVNNGSYEPEFAEIESNNQEALCEIHAGALDFVKDYLKASANMPCGTVSPVTAYSNMERLLTEPIAREVVLLGNMSFYDASIDPLVCFDSVSKYLAHPRNFISDFLRSNWKIGFLSRVLPNCRLAKSVYKTMLHLKGN